jgi:ribosomal protein S18 acetylase RimI-like enzyme
MNGKYNTNGVHCLNSRIAARNRTVVPLDLDDTTIVLRVLQLQLLAYQTEARLAGFREPPLLPDGILSIRQSGEVFSGMFDVTGKRESSRELIGAISTANRGHATEICRLMVHPEFMRQGIAGALLKNLLTACSASPLFTVTVNARNAPAIALYEKFGFKPVNRKELGPGLLFLEMQLPAR